MTLTQYGADGPPLDPPANTWVKVNAGGIVAQAMGVGDEAYDSIRYVPAIKKSVVFGKYHAIHSSYGEDQNALLAIATRSTSPSRLKPAADRHPNGARAKPRHNTHLRCWRVILATR